MRAMQLRAAVAAAVVVFVASSSALGQAVKSAPTQVVRGSVPSQHGTTTVEFPEPLFRVSVGLDGRATITETNPVRVAHTDDSGSACRTVATLRLGFGPQGGTQVSEAWGVIEKSIGDRCTFGPADGTLTPLMSTSFWSAYQTRVADSCRVAGRDRGWVGTQKWLAVWLELRYRNTPYEGETNWLVRESRLELTCPRQPDTAPPQITSATATPDSVHTNGDTVTVLVKATDNDSIASVSLKLTRQDGTVSSWTPLKRIAGTGRAGDWQLKWKEWPNPGSTPKTCTVDVRVLDRDGNTATARRTYIVRGRPSSTTPLYQLKPKPGAG